MRYHALNGAKAGLDSHEMSHGGETLILDVSRIPSFVIMLVGPAVDAGYHGGETLILDVSRIPSFVIMLVGPAVDAGAVSRHPCLSMAAVELGRNCSHGGELMSCLQPWRVTYPFLPSRTRKSEPNEMNHEYEEVLEEKRKALVSLKSGEAMYKNKKRHESVKAASIAATVGTSAALPVSLARVADTS
nr:homer protein [Tanacetum cinerariifolium]